MRFLLRILFFCAALIPRRLALYGGDLVGWLLERVFRYRTDVVDLQLQRVFGEAGNRTPEEIVAIRKGVYRHFGLLFFETLRLPCANLEYLRRHITLAGAEHLDAALKRGKGAMLINAHIGNWEIGAIGFIQAGYDLCAVSKEMRSPTVQMAMDMLRETSGMETFYRRNSARQIIKALKQNRVVVMVIDQNMIASEGEFIDFFGYPASTMPAVAALAARTGAAVLPAFSIRELDRLRHRCIIWPEIDTEQPSEDRQANVLHNMRRHNQMIEAMVELQPDQWNWIHKRWKTRPVAERENPFDYPQHRQAAKSKPSCFAPSLRGH